MDSPAGGTLPLTWRRRVLLSAIPPGVLLVVLGVAALVLPRPRLAAFIGLLVLTFPGGRFVTLLPVAQGGFGYSPLFIATLVVLVEACIAFFVSINLDVLYRLPWVGDGLRDMAQSDEAALARHPWIRRTTLVGVTLLLVLPLPTTGAVGGTVIARLAGLGVVRGLVAVVAGNALGAYVLALTAESVITWIPLAEGSGLLGALRLATLVALIVLLGWIGHRRIRRPRL
jgi:uncharacterized membrane protein